MAREEIKEGIMGLLKILSEYCITDEAKLISQFRENSRDGIATQILEFLHSQGVVLKIDRELPDENSGKHTWYEDDLGEAGRIGYRLAINDVDEAGYVAVESLI